MIKIKERDPKTLHMDMQKMRAQGKDITLKEYLPKIFGEEVTPDEYYQALEIDLSQMTVEKLLTQDNTNRWLFPEIFRDAIRRGLQYAPFYSKLVVSEEIISNTGLTMPYFNAAEAAMIDTAEGTDITTGVLTWDSKQVTISKKARGLQQSYESIMFTPIKLAAIYFEDLGIQLGNSLDAALVNVAINGDQADGTQAAVLMGVTLPNTLTYADIIRVWVRQNRMNRPSQIMLTNEASAVTLLNLPAFQTPTRALGAPLVELNLQSALPTDQDLYVHSNVPANQIIFIDKTKAFVQLTAQRLMVESERLVRKQITGEYASIITGFANIFSDARIILDYSTNITVNAGPTPGLG